MTPVMTFAHLLFSMATTTYILWQSSSRNETLVGEHGEPTKSTAIRAYARPFVGKRASGAWVRNRQGRIGWVYRTKGMMYGQKL